MPRPNTPWFRKSKNTWYVTWNGRAVSLGVQGRGNRKAAVEAFARLVTGGRNADNSDKGTPRINPATTPTVTVTDVVNDYLVHQLGRVKPETVRWLRRFLEPFKLMFGTMKASGITPHDLEAWAARRGWRPNTRVHAIRNVHAAFRWAFKKRLLAADPLAGVEAPPTESRGAEHVITADEHNLLIKHSRPEFQPFLEALWLTGARPSEIAGLTCEMVGRAVDGVIVLHKHKLAHKGRQRALYLSPQAVARLRRQVNQRQNGFVFVGRYGQSWNAESIGKAMRATCQRAGLPRRHAYGYRHAYATTALSNGIPDATVAALLGHANTDMLHKHYAHLTAHAQVLRQAAEQVRR